MAATSPIKPAALKWARPARTCEDPTKLGRLAKRVEQAMALAINPEPVRLDPHMVGVSPLNRLFSIQQVHNTILRSIIQDGHDPGRPHVGVACEIRAPEKVASLVQYNEAMAARSPLMPKVDTDLMRYEGLSCTHYNMSLRLGKDGLASPAGDLAKAKEDDATFAEAATQGHWWIILPESLADTLKGDIAAWRNQDQHGNQTRSCVQTDPKRLQAPRQILATTRSRCGQHRPCNCVGVCLKPCWARVGPTWARQIIRNVSNGL